jgi:hypothetical protein
MKIVDTRKDWEKTFCEIHPGDSGAGGNTPQEPEAYVFASPNDVWRWHVTEMQNLLNKVSECFGDNGADDEWIISIENWKNINLEIDSL